MPLRSYVEAISELTLPTLCRIIRAHYQEKNSSELYAELANLAQISTEEPQIFLIRAQNLREKIIHASKEANTKFKYDPEHVQSMFLYTTETGLIINNLRGRIRPLLQNVAISDEELISRLNLAVTEEVERSKKFAASSAKVKVKVSQVEQRKEKKTEKYEKPQEEMIAEMKAQKAKVALLEREVKENQIGMLPKGLDFRGTERVALHVPVLGWETAVVIAGNVVVILIFRLTVQREIVRIREMAKVCWVGTLSR